MDVSEYTVLIHKTHNERRQIVTDFVCNQRAVHFKHVVYVNTILSIKTKWTDFYES
jgi:hypothetical protein